MIERKRLSLAWSHVTTLETLPKEVRTCIVSPSPFPTFRILNPFPLKEKSVFRACFFPTELLSDSTNLAWQESCLCVKRAGWKIIWWKATRLCLGLNFGPLTWAIIGPFWNRFSGLRAALLLVPYSVLRFNFIY